VKVAQMPAWIQRGKGSAATAALTGGAWTNLERTSGADRRCV